MLTFRGAKAENEFASVVPGLKDAVTEGAARVFAEHGVMPRVELALAKEVWLTTPPPLIYDAVRELTLSGAITVVDPATACIVARVSE